jgi:ribosomal protein S7
MLNKYKIVLKKLKKKLINKNFKKRIISNFFFKKKILKKKKFKLKSLKKINKKLKKLAFKKKFFKPITFFYFKKLLFFVKFFYNNRIKQIKELSRLYKKKISINILSKKDTYMIKILLFLTKKKKFKSRIFVLMQKKFFYFLLKHKLYEKSKTKSYYIKKIFLSFFNKNFFPKKKIIKNYKNFLYLIKYKKKIKNNNSEFYQKLVGLLTKKGNKQKAMSLLNKALLKTSKDLKYTPNLVLKKALDLLKTSLELKKIKRRRSSHFIPFPLKKKRKLFLVSKWLLLGAKHQEINKTLDLKLNLELIELIKNRNSFSYKFKEQNIRKALQNKSNTHFRW